MLVFLIVGAIAGIVGAIAGIMLGLRLKVLILVPATLLATAVITVTGIVSGHEVWVIALTVFGAVASLQIGYFVGGILQVMIPAHLLTRTTVRYRPPKVAIVPVDVELERAGVAHLEPQGLGIREGESTAMTNITTPSRKESIFGAGFLNRQT